MQNSSASLPKAIDQILRRCRPSLAVLDAGLGGMTVVKELRRRRDDMDILYIGDSRNMPYSVHGNSWIKHRTQRLIEIAEMYSPDIVLGCNTMSTFVSEVRSMVPVSGIIEPALRWARSNVRNETLVLVGSPTTISGGAYGPFSKDVEVIPIPCARLATLIEHFGSGSSWVERCIEKEVLTVIPTARKKRVTLLLACTHYPMVKDLLVKAVRARLHAEDIAVADAGSIFANQHELNRYPKGTGKLIALVNEQANLRNMHRIKRFLGDTQIDNYRIHMLPLSALA